MAQVEIEVKERPILFSGAMVQAILEGRKTQTRRVVKPAAPFVSTDSGLDIQWALGDLHCPYGKPGDRLWVRETWAQFHNAMIYAATPAMITVDKWKPSIHMPRWASRITLEIKSVRVERIQDISLNDAVAEGMRIRDTDGGHVFEMGFDAYVSPLDAYRELWDSINAKRGFGWEKNPWCWAIEFIAPCLTRNYGKQPDNSDTSAGPMLLAIRTAQTSANGHGIAEDVAHTLDGAQGQAVYSIMPDEQRQGLQSARG